MTLRPPRPPQSALGPEILSAARMRRADAAAIAAGTPGIALMENAAAAVVRAVRARWTPRPALALCGPGNNGGDGFAAAAELARAGWPVAVALLGARERLRGDAAIVARRWSGPVEPLAPAALAGRALVIDALFGAGLSRPVSGIAAETLAAVAASGVPVAAVDTPSGVDGDTGAVLGAAAPAAVTVTFCRPRPAHLLAPGRLLCGAVEVADIGIGPAIVAEIGHDALVNRPDEWRARLPRPAPDGHKYRRGHAVVLGGARFAGAARLAARAALRAGAGLVTIAAPSAAGAAPDAVMTRPPEDWRELLADPRVNVLLIGPGAGVGAATRARVLEALAAGKAAVLDADALTSFAADPAALFAAARGRPCVLTPHDGEYARLFAARGDRLARARAAAAESGATVLLKGPECVVAAPDGRAVIGVDGPPELATAGTGDVLAGIVAGLAAAGAAPFDAACMAAWLHGTAARAGPGPGLVADDLPNRLPAVLARLTRRAPRR